MQSLAPPKKETIRKASSEEDDIHPSKKANKR